MDIRIEKTDRAIEKAFMELRARQPLEKIRIKDLCTLAKVNKSTFYAHYEDIYELSSRLENKLIHVILDSVPNVGLTAAHTEQLTRELFHAFVQNQEAVNILFSGSRQGIFANCIEKGLRERLTALEQKRVLRDPMAFIADKRLLLDYTQKNLASLAEKQVGERRQRFAALCASLHAMSPLAVLARGYAVARKANGTVLRSADEVTVGETIDVTLGRGSLVCTVNETRGENNHGKKL